MIEPENTDEGAPAAPEPAPTPMPKWWEHGDVNECEACGKRRPHTIRRLNKRPARRLCDECHGG